MSAATAVATSQGLAEGIRRQAWQHVTCTPICPNAGPFTIYGPAGPDVEKYYCAACGYLMRTTEASKLR